MSNKSISDHGGVVNPEASSSQAECAKEDHAEIISDSEGSAGRLSNHSRRAGPSKREIMEELSRQRFPWDE